MRFNLLSGIAMSFCLGGLLWCRTREIPVSQDSDHDGLSDQLEQSLLQQFAPDFRIGQHDCSTFPSEFQRGVKTPLVGAHNGTVYGQVFPVRTPGTGQLAVEIHFYHLWGRDCGSHPHPLDAEHVSVLVRPESASERWKALYWYAAAHENTICDQSQIARAATLDAEYRGATVWISPGKHASYLKRTICGRGCGADRCENMTQLHVPGLINLGETGSPMNDSLFISSGLWPLTPKMVVSNFPAASLSRVNELPAGEIAWFNEGRHPAQGVIAISSSTEGALAGSGRATTSALSVAGDSTGGALQSSYEQTKHALGSSLRHTRRGLRITAKRP